MGKTTIEWCDYTFNPWIGCTKVSEGCRNCYAETLNRRYKWCTTGTMSSAGGIDIIPAWGRVAPRKRTSAANWKGPLKWDKEAAEVQAEFPGETKMYYDGWNHLRPRIFCASLADWLDPEVPVEWFVDLLRLWFICQNLDILALTKRPENWNARIGEARKYFSDKLYRLKNASEEDGDFLCWLCSWHIGESAPKNVWVGATVENQAAADKRIPELLNIPARVRFLSCEPLLGEVRLDRMKRTVRNGDVFFNALTGKFLTPELYAALCGFPPKEEHKIHQVICGGESGPHARPMHPDWARALRDQCKAAGVPFFFKQHGEWAHDSELENVEPEIAFKHRHQWPDGSLSYRVGKRASGRLLDSVEHNEFPESSVPFGDRE